MSGVHTGPGATVFARMPLDASSCARPALKFWIAPFVVAYASSCGLGVSALIDAVLMMLLPGFMCGTAAEITPIRTVDGKPVGTGKPGPVTARVQELFFGLFSGKTPDRYGWLEPAGARE